MAILCFKESKEVALINAAFIFLMDVCLFSSHLHAVQCRMNVTLHIVRIFRGGEKTRRRSRESARKKLAHQANAAKYTRNIDVCPGRAFISSCGRRQGWW